MAAAGPFAPVAAAGPFAPQPVGTTWVDQQCPVVCGLAERLGCPITDCLTECTAALVQVPEACQAAYGAYIECVSASGTCDQNGEVQATACDQSRAAVSACVRAAQPNPPNGPPVPRPDGGQVGGP